MNNLLIQGDNVVAMKWLIENGYKGKIHAIQDTVDIVKIIKPIYNFKAKD